MYAVTVNGKRYEVELIERRGPLVVFNVEGVTYSVEVNRTAQLAGVPMNSTRSSAAATPAATSSAAVTTSAPGEIRSPMPGIIVDVKVKVGDKVDRGKTVAVIEAMKMENNIVSSADGVVKEIKVKAGEEVPGNHLLFIIG